MSKFFSDVLQTDGISYPIDFVFLLCVWLLTDGNHVTIYFNFKVVLLTDGNCVTNILTKGKPLKKINRIFHDIVQNSFTTYPPYLIMT